LKTLLVSVWLTNNYSFRVFLTFNFNFFVNFIQVNSGETRVNDLSLLCMNHFQSLLARVVCVEIETWTWFTILLCFLSSYLLLAYIFLWLIWWLRLISSKILNFWFFKAIFEEGTYVFDSSLSFKQHSELLLLAFRFNLRLKTVSILLMTLLSFYFVQFFLRNAFFLYFKSLLKIRKRGWFTIFFLLLLPIWSCRSKC
jgi:hypothetical protein